MNKTELIALAAEQAGMTKKDAERCINAAVDAICQSFRENLRRFADLGGLIASGSDAGAWAVTHGCDTEDGLLAALDIDPTPGNLAIQAKF